MIYEFYDIFTNDLLFAANCTTTNIFYMYFDSNTPYFIEEIYKGNRKTIEFKVIKNMLYVSNASNNDLYLSINNIRYSSQRIVLQHNDFVQIKSINCIIEFYIVCKHDYLEAVYLKDMEEMYSEVKLPYIDPSIKTYPFFTNLVGILGSYAADEEWIVNNHILLWMYRRKHFSYYVANFKYSDNICPLIDIEITDKNSVLEKHENLFSFIEESIVKHQYILIPLNLYSIYECWDNKAGMQNHFCHPVLINGYNMKTKLIYVSDFWHNGYSTKCIPYSVFEKSFMNRNISDKSENKITLLKYNCHVEAIDICRIKGLLNDALYSDDTYMPCVLLRENKKEDIAYGLEYYDDFLIYLDEISTSNENHRVDIRNIHLVVELNKIMLERMMYLSLNRYIKEDPQLFDQLRDIYSKSLTIQSMALKYNMTMNSQILRNIHDRIVEIRKLQEKSIEACMLALNQPPDDTLPIGN